MLFIVDVKLQSFYPLGLKSFYISGLHVHVPYHSIWNYAIFWSVYFTYTVEGYGIVDIGRLSFDFLYAPPALCTFQVLEAIEAHEFFSGGDRTAI